MFTILYGILAFIEIGLVVKYVTIGPPSEAEALHSIRRGPPRRGGSGGADGGGAEKAEEKQMAFAY